MKKLILLICLWLLVGNALYSQVVRGRVTDMEGIPISGAAIFIGELSLGTSANQDGYYELRVPEGNYSFVFQCFGYETETMAIAVGTGIVERNISLREKVFEIREVIISSNREDPAYAIMRHAIAMAPYYLNQVSEYKAEVYLKGTWQVKKFSNLLKRLAKKADAETAKEMNEIEGVANVSESFSEIEFEAPNKYRHKVLKQTGTQTDDNRNQAIGLITTNIYDTKWLEPIISPLSTNAFAHYRFQHEGFIQEGNRVINKIKIIPRRNSKQLLSGYIYIADNFWNVHSADISGEFAMGIGFRFQFYFGEVNNNIWVPVSHRIDMNGSVLGMDFVYHYVSSVKYTDVVENTSIRKPDALAIAEQQNKPVLTDLTEIDTPATKTSEKIEDLLAQDNLSNRQAYQLARLMQKEIETGKKENQSLDITSEINREYMYTVDSTANVRDTAFWEMMRPVPLNPDELKSYHEKEIKLATPDTAVNNNRNKPQSKINNVLFGTNIKLGEKGGTIEYRGIEPSQLGFNTVDGFYVGQKLQYSKKFSQYNRLSVTPEVVWAINRKTVMWDVDASLTYSPMRRGNANIKFGQKSADFNNFRGIHQFENTISSLLFKRNYMKLYENHFVEVSNTIDIANGLQMSAGMKYAYRKMLENNSDYSFFYQKTREYTSNIPQNAELATSPPANHTAAIIDLRFDYTPRHYYRVGNGNQKSYVKSAFPTFSASWQKGISGLRGSNSDFDHIALGIRQELNAGMMRTFKYAVSAGAFINNKNVFFADFKHFATVGIPITINFIDDGAFNLLEYYRYSTADKYLETHLYYKTPFLILKYLPFFRNLMLMQEGIQINYLTTPIINNYTEFGYTIGINSNFLFGAFAGFNDFKYRNAGIKLSIKIR